MAQKPVSVTPSKQVDVCQSTDNEEHTVSWLVLCLGQNGDHSTSRKRKGFDEKEQSDDAKEDDAEKVRSRGLEMDFAKVVGFSLTMHGAKGQDPRTGHGMKVNSHLSPQSALSDDLTADDVQNRIVKWLDEDADEFVFYFSGEGSQNPRGFAVKKGVYEYRQLAKTINEALKYKDERTPMVTIVLDTCYSGGVETDFVTNDTGTVNGYQQSKYNKRCMNDQGALFYVFYSTQHDAVSVEDEDGGIYTTIQFGSTSECRTKWLHYFVNGVWDEDDWNKNTFKDHDIVQKCGSFDYRPDQLSGGQLKERFPEEKDRNFQFDYVVDSDVMATKGLSTVKYIPGKEALEISPSANGLDQGHKAFQIKSFHVCCQSDKIESNWNYFGIVLYQYKEGDEWVTKWEPNGLRVRGAYIFLKKPGAANLPGTRDRMKYDKMNSAEKRNWDNTADLSGTHIKMYELLTGEPNLTTHNVIGGGFSIQPGNSAKKDDMNLVYNSSFNQASDGFHNSRERPMSKAEKLCIRAAIKNWQSGKQNTWVKDVRNIQQFK